MKKSKCYMQKYHAFQVGRWEKVSIMYGKNKVRVKRGDYVATDADGSSFVVKRCYFERNFQIV